MTEPRDISDEAVEAAARAMNLEAGRQRGLAFEDDWERITEQERGGWRLCARVALAAALPFLSAEREIANTSSGEMVWHEGRLIIVPARASIADTTNEGPVA